MKITLTDGTFYTYLTSLKTQEFKLDLIKNFSTTQPLSSNLITEILLYLTTTDPKGSLIAFDELKILDSNGINIANQGLLTSTESFDSSFPLINSIDNNDNTEFATKSNLGAYWKIIFNIPVNISKIILVNRNTDPDHLSHVAMKITFKNKIQKFLSLSSDKIQTYTITQILNSSSNIISAIDNPNRLKNIKLFFNSETYLNGVIGFNELKVYDTGNNNITKNGIITSSTSTDLNKSIDNDEKTTFQTDSNSSAYWNLSFLDPVSFNKISIINRDNNPQDLENVIMKITLSNDISYYTYLKSIKNQDYTNDDILKLSTSLITSTINSLKEIMIYFFENDPKGSLIAFNELKVFDNSGNNIANKGVVSSSSVWDGFNINSSIDKDESSSFASKIDADLGAWWKLSFSTPINISKISLVNRDVDPDHLSHTVMKISLNDNKPRYIKLNSDKLQEMTIDKIVKSQTDIIDKQSLKEIYIYLFENDPKGSLIAFNELKVLDLQGNNIANKGIASSSTPWSGFDIKSTIDNNDTTQFATNISYDAFWKLTFDIPISFSKIILVNRDTDSDHLIHAAMKITNGVGSFYTKLNANKTIEISKDALPSSTQINKAFTQLYFPGINKLFKTGDTFSFKNSDSGKICSDDTNGILCNRDVVGYWEMFKMNIVDANTNKIGIKSGRTGNWCSDMGTDTVHCDTANLNTYETFQLIPLDNSKFLIKSGRTGQNCKFRDGKMTCNGPSYGNPDEIFMLM